MAAMKTAPSFHEWKGGETVPISPTVAMKEGFSFTKKEPHPVVFSASWTHWLILGLGILLLLIVFFSLR